MEHGAVCVRKRGYGGTLCKKGGDWCSLCVREREDMGAICEKEGDTWTVCMKK